MTENDHPSLQTESERETNQQLQFDTDWETTEPGTSCPSSSSPPNTTSASCNGCFELKWESSKSRGVCVPLCFHFH